MGRHVRDSNSVVRIALLISMYFPPEPGGGATAAWNRALILSKIGFRVFVLCGFPSYPTGQVKERVYKGKFFYIEKIENFNLIRVRLLPIASKGYLRRLVLFLNFIFLSLIWMPKILRIVLNLELVYAITPTLFCALIGYIYSKFTKSFFIYESSDLWPEQLTAIRTNVFFLINYLGRILAKISYTLPDMIVVTSKLAAEFVNNKYHPSVSVYSLPIGVDASKYHTVSKEASRIELIQNKIIPKHLETKFIVLYAGTLNRVTKVENLFYAANRLKDIKNDIVFLIIGTGDEKEKLEKIKLNLEIKNLVLLPFPPRIYVPKIISSADVCVVTLSHEPIYKATIPTKFFEYLACHKAQIGICNGELASMINNNHIGFTVKDGDIDKLINVILTLKSSPHLMSTMEENSRNALQMFSLNNLSYDFAKVLRKEIRNR